MSTQLKENADGSLGMEGANKGDANSGINNVSIEYNASSVSKASFVAVRAYRVKGITGRVTVAGTDLGAVTLTVVKVASGTAIASGTALHSGTMDLKGTANTNQALTLSTTRSDLDIAAGDCIGIVLAGTLTAATGTVTISLAPA